MAWGGYNLTPSWSDFTGGLKTLLPGGEEPDWSSGFGAAGSAITGGALAIATAPLNIVGAAVLAPSSDYKFSDAWTAIANTYRLGGGDDFGGGAAPFTIADAFHTVLTKPIPNYIYTTPSRDDFLKPGTQGPGDSPLLDDVKEAALPVGLILAAIAAFALGGNRGA